MIDPGHGGNDPGAMGNGLLEKDITLKLALKIRERLQTYHVKIYMTRDQDKTVELKERTDLANRLQVDYFLSLHVNANSGTPATGFESFVHPVRLQNTNKLRNTIHDEVIKLLDNVRDRGKKEANFHVLRETKMPASLFENLFINNPSDAKLLKQESFLNKLADGYVNGLVKAFNLTKKEEPNKDVWYRVITGSFRERENAERRVKELRKAGFESFIDVKRM